MRRNGGPAFPLPEGNGYEGMTLQDYFAGEIISELIRRAAQGSKYSEMAEKAYGIAALMVKVKEKYV